jgi:predicted dehydrogenase
MNETQNAALTSRREFLKSTGRLAAASALAGIALPHVHAAGSDQIQLALVGCGGRGTGAVANALGCSGPPKLVAMADVFESKLTRSYDNLQKKFNDQVEVPEDRKFIGFDGFKKAIDCLKKGDIAIFATPPAFRWVHFQYAIQKGVHVFMEKPISVDAPTGMRMIELAREADKKNLKVGVGLMIRHCRGRQELQQRIADGEIGDLIMMRAYRMAGPIGSCFSKPKPDDLSELQYQIQRFHSFLWASGGAFSDFNIHQVDELCMMKQAWPVKAHATGGRHYRVDPADGVEFIDQNFDAYSVEYTFEDGTKLFFDGRNMHGCKNEFASYAHGSKGVAIVSTSSHSPGRVRTFRGHTITRDNMLWAFPQPEISPYDLEWQDLIEAIRNDTPYNEVERGAMGSMITSMGRFAAHTGQEVTWEDYSKNPQEFAPGADQLTLDGVAPLLADAAGKYPVPQPGIKKDREY